MTITYNKLDLDTNAAKYCLDANTSIVDVLGFGTQGCVYLTGKNTALKIHAMPVGYQRELAVYQRLKEEKIHVIRGLQVPRLVAFDDKLLAIEMSIVHVPCLLDFGSAYLDEDPEHVRFDSHWFSEKEEEFGENWEEAQAVIRELMGRVGIFLADVNTGNIKF